MRTRYFVLCAVMTLIPIFAGAQVTEEDLENDFGARVNLSLDKRIVKGFHVIADAEGRLSDDFKTFGRYQAGIGLTYKAYDFLKFGVGYTFIEKKNNSGVWKPRHRAYGDMTLTLKAGIWRFSLKERIQLTHMDVGNRFQKVPNAVELKSRVKVAFKPSAYFEPYAYFELRTRFNDPACTATWSTTSMSYSDYSFKGYTDAYNNRFRGALGTVYNFDSNHSLDFFLLGDYCHEKNIDTNAEGTTLKSLTYKRNLNFSLGIGYTFSF